MNASEGRCTLAWKIDDELLNMQGTMHGGLLSSVIDTATTMALTITGTGARGVSLELSVRYIEIACYIGTALNNINWNIIFVELRVISMILLIVAVICDGGL